MIEKIVKQCAFCGNVLQRYPSCAKEGLWYCNLTCKHSDNSWKLTGEKNPNFGKKWDDEKRSRQSEIVRQRMDNPVVKEKCSSGNKGKTFDENRRKAMSEAHKGVTGLCHSEESRNLIGLSSKERWENPEFRAKIRKTKEERGLSIPLNEKSNREIYDGLSNWTRDIFSVLSKEDIFLLKRKDIRFVRDHKFSRSSGFNLGVHPVIMRHPANCEVITTGDNTRKMFKQPDSITLDQLFEKIETCSYHWHEQKQCLAEIAKYRIGQKFNVQCSERNDTIISTNKDIV